MNVWRSLTIKIKLTFKSEIERLNILMTSLLVYLLGRLQDFKTKHFMYRSTNFRKPLCGRSSQPPLRKLNVIKIKGTINLRMFCFLVLNKEPNQTQLSFVLRFCSTNKSHKTLLTSLCDMPYVAFRSRL